MSEFDTDAPLDTPPTNFDHVVYEFDPPKEPEPEIHGDRAGLDDAAAELRQTKAERNVVTERTWGHPDDWSKHAPGNYQVSAEHAADALKATRETEAWVAQLGADAEIARAIDELRAAQPEQPEFQQVQPQGQASLSEQPELQPQPEYAPPESNPELDRLLQGLAPEGRTAFLDNYHRVVQQAQYQASAQYSEALQRQAAAEQQLHQGVKEAGQIALAGLLVAFPELNGLNGDPARLQVALQTLEKANPQRHQQLANHVSQVRQTIQVAQQQAAQEQVRQYAVAQQQQQQQQEQWQRWAARQDETIGDVAPEVQKEIVRMAEEGGISKNELWELYNSNPALRHSAFQAALRDAALYRMSKRSIPQAVSRPVPSVQKPGVSDPSQREERSEYASLARQFAGQSLTPKQAAQLLIAKRAR